MYHVHTEVRTFLFTSKFDVDAVNGIGNLQFEYYIFALIGRVVFLVELGFTCFEVSNFYLLRFVVNVLTFMF